MGILARLSLLFPREMGKAAMLKDTYCTDTVGNKWANKIPLPTSLDEMANWGKTMNIINTKDFPDAYM